MLITDPWLGGTAYFGSWGLQCPPDRRRVLNAARSPFVWFSHGHPDHLHEDSLTLLDPRRQEVLLPTHYSNALEKPFRERGFRVRLLRFKEWTPLAPGLRVMCLQHANQDALLVIEAGDALIIDRNDCPLLGERRFLRRLVRRYAKTFLLSICAFDADMLNLVDARGRRAIGPPDERKPGTIWDLSVLCTFLGVRYNCCSSSQHVYLRPDSAWANPYRIGYADLRRWWNAPRTELVPPFVTFDLETMRYARNHRSDLDAARIGAAAIAEDWSTRMTPEDWRRLAAFFAAMPLLEGRCHFVDFTVASERRRVWSSRSCARVPEPARKGFHFHAPHDSLMRCVEGGYFDDLLIGNFVRTELLGGARLYPDFTPIVAKLAGNAGVRTRRELRRFRAHYLRLSPAAYARDACHELWSYHAKPALRRALKRLGLLEAAKRTGRRAARLPSLPRGDAVHR